MKSFMISMLIGLVAAVIDTAPMVIRKMDKYAIFSAFFTWIVLGIFIPRINFVSISFLNGIIVAILFVLPILVLMLKFEPKSVPIVVATTIVLGSGVGFFSKIFLG